MPERGEMEQYSNPMAPSGHDLNSSAGEDSHPLTNDDFRKMMMTPRVSSKPSVGHSGGHSTVEHSHKEFDPDDAGSARREKKRFYARLKKSEEDKKKELAAKYRDRAGERRKGEGDIDQTDPVSTTADYRAVAPDAKSGENYAERRKQLIQESKYLGGDMEHTHLVKGLDYALLEKVRAEISTKEMEEDSMLEEAVNNTKEEKNPEEGMQFTTKLGRNIFRTLFKPRAFERNELFLPGRMAYVFDLEDEYVETDVPTTLIRSKADCPSLESTTTLTSNDIVINKLTQILSYLRQGRRDRKKKKDKGLKVKDDDTAKEKLPGHDEAIYSETGVYAPSYNKSSKDKDRERGRDRRDRDRERDRDRGSNRDRDRDRDRDRGRDRRDRDKERDRGRKEKRSYFEKPAEEDDVKPERQESAKDLVRSINEKFSKGWTQPEEDPVPKKKDDEQMKKLKRKTEIDSYAECYPGMMESADAIDDSDEEADYTKMDLGNKKGPVGRWDFETAEEYSDYMSNKEALPKAAFQYGVKMSDGRKTRRTGPKDEKAALDREWQQIQNIMHKRKEMGGGGSSSKKSKH